MMLAASHEVPRAHECSVAAADRGRLLGITRRALRKQAPLPCGHGTDINRASAEAVRELPVRSPCSPRHLAAHRCLGDSVSKAMGLKRAERI
ncbi:jg1153 [Pararge aegeria aegeria]|uniref:Jg1153 protein n=1 Tax=Pararge aegeria aegeria TaxID=348720 RepID=A0A8S4QKJ2_9NEOP|nr:jg1153 [Pararge aegeria aegeria]